MSLDYGFYGVHCLGELYGIPWETLRNISVLERILTQGIAASGATLCGIQSQILDPGVTIVAMLSESHAAIHTYPEKGSLFVDIFTCGAHCFPLLAIKVLIGELSPSENRIRYLRRGRWCQKLDIQDGTT